MGDLVLVEASPAGYKELGSAHIIEGRAFTAPAFANGKVFVRNTKGDVVCVELGPKVSKRPAIPDTEINRELA